MKNLIFSNTSYIVVNALIGAYFLESEKYGLAFMNLVIILMCLRKEK